MGNQKEYDMLFKLNAKLGSEFNGTFASAQKTLSNTQKEIQELGKVQGNISSYTKQQQAVDSLQKKMSLYEQQLSNVRKEIDGTDKYSAALANKELALKQKIEQTKSSIDAKTKALYELDDALKASGVDTDHLAEESRRLSSEMEDLKSKEEAAGEEAAKYGEKSASGFQMAGEALVAAGITAGLKKIYDEYEKCVNGAASYADQISTLSLQYGISTEKLQAYYYASELVDVSVETLTSSMSRNVRSMASARDGAASYAEAYRKLGVSVVDVNGKLRDSEIVYWEVIDALGAIENVTERDALTMTLLGRSAQELNPLIVAGSSVMQDYAEKAEKTGYIMSDTTLKSMQMLDDEMKIQKNNVTALKNAIGSANANELTALKKSENEILAGLAKFSEENPGIIQGITAGGLVIGGTTIALTGYAVVAKIATAASTALTAAIPGAPIILGIAAAIAAVTGAIVGLTASERKNRQEVEALTAKAREFDETIANVEETYGKTSVKIESTSRLTEEYIARLRELERQGINTRDAQNEYALVVEKLNALLPELNLTIDEQTGLVKGGTEEILNYANAWKEAALQEALYKKYKGEIDAWAEAKAENAELQVELDKLKNISGAMLMNQRTIEAIDAAIARGDEETAKRLRPIILAQREFLENNVESVQRVYNLRAALEQSNKKLAEADGKIEEAQSVLDAYNKSIGTTSSSISIATEAYDELYQSAYDSISGQFDLWDQAAKIIPSDIDKINTALQTQAEYWEDYTTDLNLLRSENNPELNKIIATYADGSTSSVNFIAGLARASEEERAALIYNYAALIEAQNKAANAAAGGYAGGTVSATAGWHLVGENGPELAYFNGGESVLDADKTARVLSSSSSYVITIAPRFEVLGGIDGNDEEKMREYSEVIADMVIEKLEEIGVDAKRGAYT